MMFVQMLALRLDFVFSSLPDVPVVDVPVFLVSLLGLEGGTGT